MFYCVLLFVEPWFASPGFISACLVHGFEHVWSIFVNHIWDDVAQWLWVFFSLGLEPATRCQGLEHICRRKYSEIALDEFLMGDYDFIAIHCP